MFERYFRLFKIYKLNVFWLVEINTFFPSRFDSFIIAAVIFIVVIVIIVVARCYVYVCLRVVFANNRKSFVKKCYNNVLQREKKLKANKSNEQ